MKRLLIATSAAVLLVPLVARADGTSAAQALFDEAMQLMKQDRYGLACPKLEESLRLDYGIGAEFNLADCNEHLGKLATAWSGFLNVVSVATSDNQTQRANVARRRAAALELRLPTLRIDVPQNLPSNVEVKRDGVALGPAAWGVALPVDPGSHRIDVIVPGSEELDTTVVAAEGKAIRIGVPATLAPVAPPPAVVAAPTFSPLVRPLEPAAAPFALAHEEPTTPDGTQRSIGWLTSGIGIAGVATAFGFGLYSLSARERAQHRCVLELCTEQGLRLRRQAIASGDVATAVGLAGGAVLLGGIVLLLSAPAGHAPQQPSGTSLRPSIDIAANSGSISLRGTLP